MYHYNAVTRSCTVDRPDLFAEVRDYDRPFDLTLYSLETGCRLDQVTLNENMPTQVDRLTIQTGKGKVLFIHPRYLKDNSVAVKDLTLA